VAARRGGRTARGKQRAAASLTHQATVSSELENDNIDPTLASEGSGASSTCLSTDTDDIKSESVDEDGVDFASIDLSSAEKRAFQVNS
jgi:hypothetical protein